MKPVYEHMGTISNICYNIIKHKYLLY
jgi:hypothetical protein